MTSSILLIKSGGDAALPEWQSHFARFAPELEVRGWDDPSVDDARVRYALVYQPEPGRLARYPDLSLILSAAAGVDHILADAARPKHVPIVRMVTDETRERMSDYVTFAALALTRDMPGIIEAQRNGGWASELTGRLASETRVGILGLGQLGQAIARRLQANGFPVSGWSRSPKELPGIASYAGDGALDTFLAHADILVNVLPNTAATRGILGRRTFARLPRGAGLVQVGRGSHLDRQALVEALDDGHLRGAVLDVFEHEPLASDDPLRRHPRVLITPHVASTASWGVRARQAALVLQAHARGEALPFLFDPVRGY